MTAIRILGLGTYPIQKPIHGGQRRVAAFKRFYEDHNIAYSYAGVYNTSYYKQSDIGVYDYHLDVANAELWLTSMIADLMAGKQAATDPATFEHFLGLVERLQPDFIELEQPFMWPVAKRLRHIMGSRKPRLIYSSQNIEAPLKRTVLASSQAQPQLRDNICSEIESMEAELGCEADAIVCVSRADHDFYRHELKTSCRIIVVPNGVDRVSGASRQIPEELSDFGGRRYLMTVSSANFPTIQGMLHYVIDRGVFCVPPRPSIAICGGIAGAICNDPEYQRYGIANKQRIRFFFEITDSELLAIKCLCHGIFLPIRSGGGTNLKTAEALALGKWVVATATALRGFERFLDAEGVIVADTPADFRQAMRQVLERTPLEISERSRAARDTLYWDRCFADSELPDFFGHLAPN